MDDDVLDSWEDAIDTGELEKRMEEREKELRVKEEVEQRQNEAKCLAKAAGPSMIAPQEELGRTEYVPQIKILKRQNGPTSKSVQQQTKKPIKTLAEKEAEYAAARARILGDYSNTVPEHDPKKVILMNDSVIIRRPDTPESPVNYDIHDEDYRR